MCSRIKQSFKRIFWAFSFVLSADMSSGQAPVNDECTGAILLTVNTDNSCTNTYSGDLGYCTQSYPSCVSSGYEAKDVWFKFVATSSSQKIILTPLTYRDYVFELLGGSCGNLTSIACVNSGGANESDVAIVNNLTAGNTYYIRVYNYYGGGTPESQFSLCINTSSVLLDNDDCNGALNMIPCPGNCSSGTSVTNIGATQSMSGCFGIAEDDMWFKFTATSNRHRVSVVTEEDVNPVLEIFDGTCGALTSITCRYINNGSPYSFIDADLTNFIVGHTYYYRVYGSGSNSSKTNYTTYVHTLDSNLPSATVANVDDKCQNDPDAKGKLINPPLGAEITVLQDGNPVTYEPADSSFLYFVNGVIGVGIHTIMIKYSNVDDTIQTEISYVVSPTIIAGVSISGTVIINQGSSASLTASPVNGGPDPTYQWMDSTDQNGWRNITNATNSTLSYKPASTGNKVKCVMISNAHCVSSGATTSNILAFTLTIATAVNPTPSNYGIKYFPNPVISTLVIDSLNLSDQWQILDIMTLDGRQKIITKNINDQTTVNLHLDRLPRGYYIAILRSKIGRVKYLKFIKL
jgi:hypothetical protein